MDTWTADISGGNSGPNEEAALVAESLVYVDMRRIHSHGVYFLKLLSDRIEANMVSIPTRLQIRPAIIDTMGLCLFARPPFIQRPELFSLFLQGRYGWGFSFDQISQMGADVLKTERELNERAGISEKFHQMPEFMCEEPLPPKNAVFDIPFEEMERVWEVMLSRNVFWTSGRSINGRRNTWRHYCW